MGTHGSPPYESSRLMGPPPQRIKQRSSVCRSGSRVRSRLPLPEPLGQDIFGPATNLHALVQGRGIGPAVGKQVVPRDQFAGFRLDGLADSLEPRRAAVLRLVQIDHRGPGALSAVGGVNVEIIAAGLERVGMRLELLARRVALTLQ